MIRIIEHRNIYDYIHIEKLEKKQRLLTVAGGERKQALLVAYQYLFLCLSN